MGRRKVGFPPELRSVVLGEEEAEAKVWSSRRASDLRQSIVRHGREKKERELIWFKGRRSFQVFCRGELNLVGLTLHWLSFLFLLSLLWFVKRKQNENYKYKSWKGKKDEFIRVSDNFWLAFSLTHSFSLTLSPTFLCNTKTKTKTNSAKKKSYVLAS